MAAEENAPGRGSSDAPVRWFTVLSDPACPLCRHLRGWLERQRQLVPLEFVDVASAEARARFPQLDHARSQSEITVVSDDGQVYEGSAAWIACLWALEGYRVTAHRLSTPTGAPLARAAVLAAARWRKALARRDGREVGAPTVQGAAGSPTTRPYADADAEADVSCGGECYPRSG
ncbi:putative DCC family thiol-disulfide oxidoreductase YuxK [Streptacidiphilus sp. MAP12-20]|uniref:thiol-disulfide oxidoreductase DCC family protein n=1 Tax=Streptacidiphilus sp. MAP12-20 TaxID=3156299 RepID=UPI003518F1D9